LLFNSIVIIIPSIDTDICTSQRVEEEEEKKKREEETFFPIIIIIIFQLATAEYY
jgi:peroxiredoxin